MQLSELKPKEKFTLSLDAAEYTVVSQQGLYTEVTHQSGQRTRFPSSWDVTQVDEPVEYTRRERNQFARQRIINTLNGLIQEPQSTAGSFSTDTPVVTISSIQDLINGI